MRSYFAHPYHNWERGTNENANGLMRLALHPIAKSGQARRTKTQKLMPKFQELQKKTGKVKKEKTKADVSF